MSNYINILPEFKINDYLIVRLENKRTNVYVGGRLFNQCKFLLLNIPIKKIKEFNDIESIDEIAEKLDKSMEIRGLNNYHLTPEIEFWGHCSNLQAWYEHDYDTRIIHRNLAFPLLRALVRAGDPLAKRVFKEEIAMRLESGYPSVVSYLINQNYLKYLKRREINTILENPNFRKNISNYVVNLNNIPRRVYKNLRKLIPRKKRRDIFKPEYIGVYDAIYKIIVFGEAEVEKTQLIQRFITNLFNSDSKMTLGVDFSVKRLQIDDKRVKLQIWDFDSEERFRFLFPNYIRGANGGFFIYDASNYNSLAHIDDWLIVIKKEIKQEDIFPIIVVGIVSDLDNERRISAEKAIKIAKSRGVDGLIECNPRTGENVEETFESITRLMLTRSGLL